MNRIRINRELMNFPGKSLRSSIELSIVGAFPENHANCSSPANKSIAVSVTFWCPEAPCERDIPYPDEPDYVESRSILPELTVSNSNAQAICELAGLVSDEYQSGELSVAELDGPMKRLRALMEDSVARAAGLEPPTFNDEVLPDGTTFAAAYHELATSRRRLGCVVFSQGRSDDYLRDRAARLLALFEAAKQHGYRVVWG